MHNKLYEPPEIVPQHLNKVFTLRTSSKLLVWYCEQNHISPSLKNWGAFLWKKSSIFSKIHSLKSSQYFFLKLLQSSPYSLTHAQRQKIHRKIGFTQVNYPFSGSEENQRSNRKTIIIIIIIITTRRKWQCKNIMELSHWTYVVTLNCFAPRCT